MDNCPNLSISPYKELVNQFGPGAANVVSVLLDSADFQQWYGSPNLPEINNLQIENNKGKFFDVDKFLQERKKLVAKDNGIGKSYQQESTAQQVADIFNTTNARAKQYEAVVKKKMSGFVTGLVWRKEAKPSTPIAFSQAPVVPVQSTQQVTSSQQQFQTMLDTLKVNIQERIDRKRKQLTNLTDARYAKAVAELDRLLKSLEGITGAAAVSKVIDDVHSKLLADKGVLAQVTKLAADLEKGLADKTLSKEQMLEKVTRLREFQQYVKDFSSLQDFYHLLPASNVHDPSSPQGKLDAIYRTQQQVQQVYQKTVEPLMVRLLSPYLSKSGATAAIALQNSLKAIERRLEVAKAKGDTISETRLEKQKAQKMLQLSQAVGNEEGLLELLRSTTKDVGMLEYLFGTTTGTADAILSTFSLFIKDFRVQLDQKLQVVGLEAIKKLDAFQQATGRSKNDPAKFNEGLYETVTRNGRSTLHFVQEIDWNAFYAEESSFFAALDGLSPQEAQQLKAVWYSQNKEPLPQAQIDAITEEKREQLKNGVITQEEYSEWYTNNHRTNQVTGDIEYIRELTQPRLKKYQNVAWLDLHRPENAAKKEYYDYLRELQRVADEKLPVERRLGTKLPNIRQGLTDNLLQGTLTPKLLWERLKGGFSSDEYADELTYGVDGEMVPVKFTGSLPADQVSRDLLSSVLVFTQAAETYEQNTKLLPFAQSMRESVQSRDIQVADGAGEKVLRAGANKLGLNVAASKEDGGNAYKLLDHFINTNLLGKESDKTVVLGMDVGKAVGAVMGIASKTQIGGPFNWLKSATNWISAEISIGLEAWAGEFLTVKQWGRGKALAAGYLGSGDALKDFASPQATSLTGQILDYWSPIPEGFKDKFGREISTSQFRRHAGMGTWFLGSKFGEMSAQYGMFLGMLEAVTVKQNGKDIPATEAYELDEKGVLRLKEGVEWSEEDQRLFKNRIDALSKRLHGVYNDFDKSVMAKHSLFRIIVMYKKFLEPGIKRRFAGHTIDNEMDAELEGYYRTLARNMWVDWRETLDALVSGKDYTGEILTPREVKNLRIAAQELAVTFTFMTVAAILAGMGDDDGELKDNTFYQLALYQTMRQGSELGLYLPGIGSSDQLRLFSSPSALSTTVERMVKLTGQVLPWNIADEYESTSKYHKKGSSKTLAQIRALLGINSADPEKVLDSYRRFF